MKRDISEIVSDWTPIILTIMSGIVIFLFLLFLLWVALTGGTEIRRIGGEVITFTCISEK